MERQQAPVRRGEPRSLTACHDVYGRCLLRDHFHHSSRLLLARLAWWSGQRAALVRKHCEMLLTKRGTSSKKPVLMWYMWQYSAADASDDSHHGTSMRTYELHDECVLLGRLYTQACACTLLESRASRARPPCVRFLHACLLISSLRHPLTYR